MVLSLWKLLRPRGVQLLQRNRVAESENSEEEEDLDNDPIGEVLSATLHSTNRWSLLCDRSRTALW